MMFRALVTGASGFVGRRLTSYLGTQEGWTVRGCDLTLDGEDADYFRACDIVRRDEVDSLMAWANSATHVFHLAAVTFVPDAAKNPTATMRTNFDGTVNLVEAMKSHTPNARLLFVSTSEVYGPPQALPITEDHALNPQNAYAESKAKSDRYCLSDSVGECLDIVCLRPFNHSGAGQSDRFVLSEFARRVARIELGKTDPIIRVGNLQSWKDFTHVDDVVRAYTLAALQALPGEAYNICTGESRMISEAIEQLQALATRKFSVEVDPEKFRPDSLGKLYGSYEKLRLATGWKPTRDFHSLMGELFEHWMKEEARGTH